MNKKSLKIVKTAFMFSILVFGILALSVLLTGAIIFCLYRHEIIDHRTPGTGLFIFALISLACGMMITKFVSKRAVEPIVKISQATKEIAKGNFDIQINENLYTSELSEMAHNFNLMAGELAGTEILRNDFVENVSHEFKTPLTAIEGYVTLLQKKGLPEEKKAEYIAKILHNTKRLSQLTGNILLLSRLENQEIEIQKEKYPLDEQLREIILSFETQWSKKALDLDIDLKSVDYFGNKELLAQVWQNLIGNAIKFVPDGGKICVVLRKTQSGVRVCVEDNGIGMSKEVCDRIYEKFYQGDSSRTGSGNGLGLTLVKRIVDLHDGEIVVSSKEGQGSSFAVILPDIR